MSFYNFRYQFFDFSGKFSSNLEKLFSCSLLKMPKKSKIVVQEPEPEPVIEEKAEEIKISKRTGKPVRPLTALQMETLRKGRELAVAKRKQLIEGVDLEKRASDIKKAKDELKLERDTKQQLRLKHQKKVYDEAVSEAIKDKVAVEEEEEVKKEPVKEVKEVKESKKKIKKKVIKYVEESSSSSSSESEEEEIIIKKKKKEKSRKEEIEPKSIQAEITRQNLRRNLEDIHSASMAAMMAPSYF